MSMTVDGPFSNFQVHGVKKDDIQLQLQGGVMDRGESNHSADTGAKYEPSLDTSHDSSILRQTQGNHDLLVRGGHDHDQVSDMQRFLTSLHHSRPTINSRILFLLSSPSIDTMRWCVE